MSRLPANAKLTEDDAQRIRALLQMGVRQADIADRFGVSHHLVSLIKLGKRWPERRRPDNACPVRIRGVDYPSQSAAARALGVTPSAINRALDRGRIDHVGPRCPHCGALLREETT